MKMLFGVEKQVSQLIELIKDMDFTDVCALGRILSVEEQDDFVEFCTDIVEAFTKQPRDKRRELIKLAKEVASYNRSSKKENSEE